MQDRGMQERRVGTGKSALALIAIAVLVVALVAVIAWALTQPGVLESVATVAAVVIVAVVIIAVIAYIVYAVLAVAFYAAKGDVVQTGVDHSLDDISAVEGNTMDDDRGDIRN